MKNDMFFIAAIIFVLSCVCIGIVIFLCFKVAKSIGDPLKKLTALSSILETNTVTTKNFIDYELDDVFIIKISNLTFFRENFK